MSAVLSLQPEQSARRVADPVSTAREAQIIWSTVPLAERLRLLQRVRALIVENSVSLATAAASANGTRLSEALAAQVLPLADACLFLEENAASILAPRRLGRRGRPLWLFGVDTQIFREPFGVVLIIAPANYPLLLPGVQALQALVAGNAVLLKPGLGGRAAADELAWLLARAGLDERLLTVLPETAEAARGALVLPVDKVFFTGSLPVGAKVLSALADRAIPCVAELSGCDAVFIRDDADVRLCAQALAFGLRLNGSATCIAPRRVFVARCLEEQFEAALCDALTGSTLIVESHVGDALRPLLHDALNKGASMLIGGFDDEGNLNLPCIVGGARPAMRIMQSDYFAPVLCITLVDGDEQALALAAKCPFALGATIFSADLDAAHRLAQRVRAGVVVINDMIVPMADPRVPFGGRGRSGFGVTRGAEGLLEMTTIKVVQVRRGRARPHFAPSQADDGVLFRDWIEAAHASGAWRRFGAAWRVAWRLIRRKPWNAQ